MREPQHDCWSRCATSSPTTRLKSTPIVEVDFNLVASGGGATPFVARCAQAYRYATKGRSDSGTFGASVAIVCITPKKRGSSG